MKKRFIYSVFVEGSKEPYCKTSFMVLENSETYFEIREKAEKRFGEDFLRINHAGRTITCKNSPD